MAGNGRDRSQRLRRLARTWRVTRLPSEVGIGAIRRGGSGGKSAGQGHQSGCCYCELVLSCSMLTCGTLLDG